MWDLSSRTRDWTCVLCIGRWILNHWTTREVPRHPFLKKKIYLFNLFIFLIFLAASGLSCSTGDLCWGMWNHFVKVYSLLRFLSSCGVWVLSLSLRSVVVARGLSCPACGMWDLSSPTRARTCIPCVGRRILYLWTTREVPPHPDFLKTKQKP